jgi:hypothetical protein
VTEADVAVAIDAVSELLRLLAQEPAEP